jgi:hypothetical protein
MPQSRARWIPIKDNAFHLGVANGKGPPSKLIKAVLNYRHYG